MYRRRYCLKWRFSLILISLRVSTCLLLDAKAYIISKAQISEGITITAGERQET